MTSWLLETLAWTAALIALVLVLRRPVTRWFGPQFAYALWALPALRLVMPPIELPAWMRPADATATAEPMIAGGTQFLILDPVTPVATQDGAGQSEAAASGLATQLTPTQSFDFGPLIEAGIAVWLIGAAIFLYMRFNAYFALRDDLLDGASEVGRDGKVRLVETHGTNAPLAFGVIDKVVALPPGFLALPDRQARDLALAHELAHHKGRDLLVNVLVQPLFAMHWFNPLGRYGWLALRRDQEAACDARVMAQRPPETLSEAREAYANLIVSFAASPGVAPNHALTAPMACPVLGEKSIIHRLRSLKMNDTPKSRRLAGRLMLGAAVVALPLTASISYAASEAPLPPAPPAPPSVSVAPPASPAAPIAPAAPLVQEIEEVDPDVDVDVEVSEDGTRSENVFVIRTESDGDSRVHVQRWVEENEWTSEGMSEEERERIIIEMREELAEAKKELDELPEILEEAMADMEAAEAEVRTVIRMSCDSSSDEVATTVENADGTRVVKLCQARVMASALEGLKQARAEIARSRDMTAEMRERVVRELDQQIERWEENAR
ncbi:ankyrin-related protein [Erythrobacter sp. NAP1]|uniref:M56 family metallopeptidase n=1 Tax=Erythrobacter sp. NAP1 TaxID=237727 RepID=UPI0000686F35|nr:M56 family metallopeptidase [Erythrobacter sp. NAP1]EAQ30378.1 ankyrin-related protein [Erythrobacter sp. NAP1]